ncbi:hypothetical protein [Oceanivirga salmonicida]|uniref:hypothetical protein n=1 Tax=Oceanivirga salmonicida TaxID=1769291 RepID=UPI00083413D4|nr:hypothetical protein [Oceanivirga salmonicida]
MNKIEQFFEKLKTNNITEIQDKYIFTISKSYYLKVFLFILIISINILYTVRNIHSLNIIVVILLLFISSYVIYSIYTVLTYKLIIENKKLIFEKNVIDLTKVDSLKIVMARIGGTKFDSCLELISEKKKYIIRLNLNKSIDFVTIISKISGKKVEK